MQETSVCAGCKCDIKTPELTHLWLTWFLELNTVDGFSRERGSRGCAIERLRTFRAENWTVGLFMRLAHQTYCNMAGMNPACQVHESLACVYQVKMEVDLFAM